MIKNYAVVFVEMLLGGKNLKKSFFMFLAKNSFWGFWEPVSYNLVTENTHLVTFRMHFITCFSTLVTYFKEILGKERTILEFSRIKCQNF